MIRARYWGPGENLTLTEAELAACRPVRGEGDRALRARCPYHGSDHQRSLRVDLATGHFTCFACGAWGYTADARERWQQERLPGGHGRPPQTRKPVVLRPQARPAPAAPRTAEQGPEPARDDLYALVRAYQAALPTSLGEEYLRRRGIPLDLALRYGVGYAAAGTWAHTARDWRWGRVVFPHTTPDGALVNLYGRAVGSPVRVPKDKRHDHLPGDKGYFYAAALRTGHGPLFVCEGPFDALSLMAAGYPRTVAIFGVHGWRWAWARDVPALVFALDADATGQEAWRALARQARLRGKRVAFLPPEAYGGAKDVNDAWVAGVLRVGAAPAASEPAALGPAAGHSHTAGHGTLIIERLADLCPSPATPPPADLVQGDPCPTCGSAEKWQTPAGQWICRACLIRG